MGLVGSAIHQALTNKGYKNLICKTHDELDLCNAEATARFFQTEKPDYVFIAAAKVGGIQANLKYPADFLYQNLMIASHLIHQSYLHNIQKLLFLGSSCIYPKHSPQPISEHDLLTGPLEYTNEPYAIAKIAGIKLCQTYNRQHGCHFISAMPCNLYGINDNFNTETGHVIPALMKRMLDARISNQPYVEIWGTGNPLREFLHADDLANACVLIMEKTCKKDIINIGSGEEISIRDLALLIKKITKYKGELIFNESQPDGTPRKILNSSVIRQMGWNPKISLEKGLLQIYKTVFN